MVALSGAFLDNVARGDDQGNVLLGDHAPQVLEGVVKRALTGNDLPVASLTEGPVDEVGVDIAADERVSFGDAASTHQVHSRVLERQNVRVSVLLFQLLIRNEHLLLHGAVRAGSQRHELSVEIAHSSPR